MNESQLSTNEESRMKTKLPTIRKRWKVLFGVIAVIFILFAVVLPIATAPRSELSDLAQDWQDSGEYIKWSSTIEENARFGAHATSTG